MRTPRVHPGDARQSRARGRERRTQILCSARWSRLTEAKDLLKTGGQIAGGFLLLPQTTIAGAPQPTARFSPLLAGPFLKDRETDILPLSTWTSDSGRFILMCSRI